MAAAHLEAPGRAVPAPVLRVRGELGGVAVRAVRAVRGVGALAGARRAPPPRHAAPARHPRAAHAEVPTDVHPVYSSETISLNVRRVRRIRQYRTVCANRLSTNARG